MLKAVYLRVIVVSCTIVAALASAGCKTTPSSDAPGLKSSDAGTKLTQVQLRERLAQFYTSYVNAIAGSIERAGQKQEDVETLRRLTLVKIRLVRTCRSAVFQENVMVAFLDTWVLCVQGRVFLESLPPARRFSQLRELERWWGELSPPAEVVTARPPRKRSRARP